MDKKKILIMDLSKGKVGEDNSALLGAMLVTKMQLAAMSRTDIPENERKDFYLYVDEFQNFATESFATILSEARKYRLNLIVGHQYIAQLEQDKNTKVRDAIFGNVGTIILFRIGAADAEFLETEFEPIFTPTDMVNLPKYNIILKLMINGVASDPFSAVTLPPNPEYRTNNLEKVIKVSRERYANPVAEVEDKISRWMGAEFHQEAAVLIGAVENIVPGPSEKEAGELVPPPVAEQAMPVRMVETVKEQGIAGQPEDYTLIQSDQGTIKEETAAIPTLTDLQEPSAGEEMAIKPSTPQRQENKVRSHNQSSHPHNRNQSSSQSHGINRQHGKLHRDRHRSSQHAPKKENPIWDTVANMQGQKNNQGNKKISEVVKRIISSVPKPEPQPQVEAPSNMPPAVEQQPVPSSDKDQNRTVLSPGQKLTF